MLLYYNNKFTFNCAELRQTNCESQLKLYILCSTILFVYFLFFNWLMFEYIEPMCIVAHLEAHV